MEPGKPDEIHCVRPPPLTREHVIQFVTIAADDGLDVTMPAAVRPAGNFGAVLALRTFKQVGLAHAIQLLPEGGKLKLVGAALPF
jgi:hypothetical protein